MQGIPPQQVVSPAPEHSAPSGLQLAHRNSPLPSGWQDVPPQHCSLNWQVEPDAMHIESPGHPVHVSPRQSVPLQQASPPAQDPFAATHEIGTTHAPVPASHSNPEQQATPSTHP